MRWWRRRRSRQELLPVDAAVAVSFLNPIDAPIDIRYVSVDAIPADTMDSISDRNCKALCRCRESLKPLYGTDRWGVFENPVLAKEPYEVAEALAEKTEATIIGGGDSAAAVNQLDSVIR